MMDMYQGMMGTGSFASGIMAFAWINWILLTVLMIAAIRWLWNQGNK